ncbi:peptidase inhibitor family I36 protein [Streptomyces sp. NPDC000229]|uniref:peptidase inhibitor family I36 protein n=1 Tax=Streptomyces sp. NPDC000229 TaxID=3154247 RepID=UPI00333359F0
MSATPADAAGGFERCPDGYMCIFDNRDSTGTMAWFRTGSPALAQQGMDDRASAFYNRTGREWNTYDGKNHQDPLIYIRSGTGGSMIAELYDNQMSSLRVR